jgi:hypothetical protein
VQPLQISRARDVLETLEAASPRPVHPVDLSPLAGTWANFDTASTGIHHLEIADRDGQLMTRTWGTGVPEPHDWGEVVAEPFTDGVALHAAVAFRAAYDLGFARVMLACYLNKRLLVVDAYTVFQDGSGRSPYFQRDHFYIP